MGTVRRIVLATVVFALSPTPSWGVACTVGSDCFCDCALNSDGTANDIGPFANYNCGNQGYKIRPRERICADFEEITYWKGMGTAPGTSGPGSGGTACSPGNDNANCYGNTNPDLFGPPYDPTGGANSRRGINGAFYRVLTGNTGSSECSWGQNSPPNPTFGAACDHGSGNLCDNLPAVWASDDRWNGNAKACMGVFRGSELTLESSATISSPSAPFDGKQSFGLRYRSGSEINAFPHVLELGFSQPRAISFSHVAAYSNNFFTSNVADYPLKGPELGQAHPFEMWTNDEGGTSGHQLFPYSHLLFFTTLSESACNTARLAMTNSLHPGDLSNTRCNPSGSINYWPMPSDYNQAVDFPLGTWGCQRASLTGIGTSSGRIEIWIGAKKIIDFSNVDFTSGTGFQTGYPATSFYMNGFANAAQSSPNGPGGGITQTAWHTEDNYLFETWSAAECTADGSACGVPPTCVEIGYPRPACDDGIDNDGDTKIDYPDDPQCSSSRSNSESTPSCGLLGIEVVPAASTALWLSLRRRRRSS